ncbi:tetratricopeptide repeat protein [Pseudomonas sp. PDM18]|uniref:tetratricopeptide repeat protein n=1 Tax=Pseudomonas sp. PDM18 TaxID=2769253 RepID=UPI001785EBC2|nr:tetratricopeptide repeat protein [Pseudomonas sp. PDM18]MBD9676589.1 tetratricopeptide repeat protein [Pseudomonas sp. PDM18]
MSQDYLGNPIDSEREDTRQAIDDFTGGVLAYQTRAENILAGAEADPASVLANAFAGLLMMFAESPQAPSLAARYLQRAWAAGPGIPRAERYTALLAAWSADDLPEALRLSELLLDEHPRDLLAAKLNQYFEFNRGNSPAMLRIALKAVKGAEEVPQAYGMLAFAYEQCHLLEEAEAAARYALHLLPGEPWAQHALAHVLLTRGRIEEGTQFLEEASAGWQGLNSFMYTHNWWHLALFHLARGNQQRVLEIYDRHVWGIFPEYSQDQIGAVSLLARLEFAGIDVGPRWEALLPYLRERRADVVQPFLSLQYLYGLARAGQEEAGELLEALRQQARQAPDFSRAAWAEVTLPAAEGLYAHARGEYALAVRRLGQALPRLGEIGGSHAQRDLFALIELDAQLRAGEWLAAQQALELRRRYDAQDVPGNRHLERVYSALGLPQEAARAARRVARVLGENPYLPSH